MIQLIKKLIILNYFKFTFCKKITPNIDKINFCTGHMLVLAQQDSIPTGQGKKTLINQRKLNKPHPNINDTQRVFASLTTNFLLHPIMHFGFGFL